MKTNGSLLENTFLKFHDWHEKFDKILRFSDLFRLIQLPQKVIQNNLASRISFFTLTFYSGC
jgi:hypothetical protein